MVPDSRFRHSCNHLAPCPCQLLLHDWYSRFVRPALSSDSDSDSGRSVPSQRDPNNCSTGRFNNVSEVVRAGLRLLEDQAVKLRELRAGIQAVDESGPGIDVDKVFNKLEKKYKSLAKVQTPNPITTSDNG